MADELSKDDLLAVVQAIRDELDDMLANIFTPPAGSAEKTMLGLKPKLRGVRGMLDAIVRGETDRLRAELSVSKPDVLAAIRAIPEVKPYPRRVKITVTERDRDGRIKTAIKEVVE